MHMREFAQKAMENKAFLDTIDFKQFMSDDSQISVDDLKEAMDDYYWKHKELLPSFLDGCVFCYLSTEELGEYLAKRYHVNCRNEVIELYFIDNPKNNA